MRILVIEDDAAIADAIVAALTRAGHAVDRLISGRQADAALQAHPYDLVVLDLGLPILDGLSIQQELAAQAISREIPVVIVTGSSDDLTHVDVSCILRKPFTVDELVRTIRRCMHLGAPGAGS